MTKMIHECYKQWMGNKRKLNFFFSYELKIVLGQQTKALMMFFFSFFFCFDIFGDRVSLWNLGCPGTDPPAPASPQVLGLRACATLLITLTPLLFSELGFLILNQDNEGNSI